MGIRCPHGSLPSGRTQHDIGGTFQGFSPLLFVLEQDFVNGSTPFLPTLLGTGKDSTCLDSVRVCRSSDVSNLKAIGIPFGSILQVIRNNNCRIQMNDCRWSWRRTVPKYLQNRNIHFIAGQARQLNQIEIIRFAKTNNAS